MTERQELYRFRVDKEEAERAQQEAEQKYEDMARALLDYLGIDWQQHHAIFTDELLLTRAAAFLRIAFTGVSHSPEPPGTGHLLKEGDEAQ